MTLMLATVQGLKAGDTRFQKVVENWRTDGWKDRSPEDPWAIAHRISTILRFSLLAVVIALVGNIPCGG